MRQRMDGCEALVACGYAAPAGFLQMLQKLPDVFGRKMIYFKLIHGFVHLASDERDEQCQGIAIALLRISSQIAFANQMLEEETPHPRPEPGLSHNAPSGRAYRSNRADAARSSSGVILR